MSAMVGGARCWAMGSPAAAEGGEEARGGGRGESGERSGVQARLTLESTSPKARSRSREVVPLDEVIVGALVTWAIYTQGQLLL